MHRERCRQSDVNEARNSSPTYDDTVTEAISTAILEEKQWALNLYLIPEIYPLPPTCKCGDCGDCGWNDEYQEAKIYLQTNLHKEFAQTYKGFASFKFEAMGQHDIVRFASRLHCWQV